MPCFAPRHILALTVALGAAAPNDPLAPYYGNTILCLAADGTDAGHLWLQHGGRYLMLAGIPVRAGRFTTTAKPDRRTTICLLPVAAPALPQAFPRAAAAPVPLPCLTLAPHAVGDRWRDQAAPGATFRLLAGQQ